MSRKSAAAAAVLEAPVPRAVDLQTAAARAVAAALPPVSPPEAEEGAVDALRRRLASGTAREHVVLDFLEDDLREAREALSGVAAWLANVEIALREGAPSKYQLLALAVGGKPGDRIDGLSTSVASVRRRLAQVAARM